MFVGQVLRVVEDEKKSSKPWIVDARGAPRFKAEVDEPRPGLGKFHLYPRLWKYIW